MNTLAYVLACVVLYVWFAAYFAKGFAPKCLRCGGNLEKRYRYIYCEDCDDCSTWYGERKAFTAIFWPIAIPLTFVWRAGTKAAGKKGD